MPVIAGQLVQANQGELDTRVPRIASNLSLPCPKGASNQHDIAEHRIEKFPLPGSFEIRNCCLKQMACDIHFMFVSQVRPSERRLLSNRVVGVQIAIVVLGRDKVVDQPINFPLQNRVLFG